MEENVAGQQVEQTTGTAAVTPTPVQPVPQAPQTQPAATPAVPGDDWHARYNGLQQAHQTTVGELQRAQALLQQNSQHAGTLEQQLVTVQAERGTLTQTVGEAQQQLAGLQVENNYWNLISTEFADLFPIASVLQRTGDLDAQRAILTTARERLGNTVQTQTQQQVAQAFQGVTPAVSPSAQPATSQFPPKEDLLRAMDAESVGSKEYQRLKAIWDRHPESGPQGLNPNFVDPMRSDWDRIRNVDQMEVVQDNTISTGAWATPQQQAPTG